MKKINVIIMGAAGRDFHNFNVFFRDDPKYKVVAFTAAQIPGIAGRTYPRELAGRRYPKGIPIYYEADLEKLIKKYDVDEVVLAYSDLSYQEVGHKCSRVLAAGAEFRILGPKATMLKSKKPVISVCAVRTGAGKSPVARKVCEILKASGIKPVVIRHPMPYGDLKKQACQRFAVLEDLKKERCTIEEMEEYGPHIAAGTIVYAGVDYAKILKQAEHEAGIIVWDGGNNDLPFIKPDIHIVVADCRRPGHEISYFPGEANLRMADIVIANKVGTADPKDVESVTTNTKLSNPTAIIIKADLERFADSPELIKGKRVVVVEDGPTLTHGGLSFGAAALTAESLGAYVVSPRKYAVGSIRAVYSEWPHLGAVLPAMGYSAQQIAELEQTINAIPADVVLIGTPIDIRQFMQLNKPVVRVRYDYKDVSRPTLEQVLIQKLKPLL